MARGQMKPRIVVLHALVVANHVAAQVHHQAEPGRIRRLQAQGSQVQPPGASIDGMPQPGNKDRRQQREGNQEDQPAAPIPGVAGNPRKRPGRLRSRWRAPPDGGSGKSAACPSSRRRRRWTRKLTMIVPSTSSPVAAVNNHGSTLIRSSARWAFIVGAPPPPRRRRRPVPCNRRTCRNLHRRATAAPSPA